MADVTDEALSTEGLYRIREGTTVDFGSLLLRVQEKCTEWHGIDGTENPDIEYCQVLLISGGYVLVLNLDFLDKNIANDVYGVIQSFVVYVRHLTEWVDDTHTLGYPKAHFHNMLVPRHISRKTVLMRSKYGESCLDGIAIEYPDEVPVEDRLSA